MRKSGSPAHVANRSPASKRDAQNELLKEHEVAAAIISHTLSGGESVQIKVNARLTWSLYQKGLLLYDRLAGRLLTVPAWDALSKRNVQIGIDPSLKRP